MEWKEQEEANNMSYYLLGIYTLRSLHENSDNIEALHSIPNYHSTS